MDHLRITNLFTLEETIAESIFLDLVYPWEALPKIGEYLIALGNSLSKETFVEHGKHIWIAKSARVAESASITGPCIIDEEAEVRHCAFIRQNAMIGKKAVVGNSTELKNVILFNQVQVPHYNYVGDSILGFRAHMGAGSITSNVKSDKSLVVVKSKQGEIETFLKKFGAMLGDYTEVGCNSVLNPGTVTGKNVNIYPTSCVRGYVEADSIYKSQEDIVKKRT